MDKLSVAIATGGYIGRIPVAPGTFGSIPGLLLYFFMAQMPVGYALGLLAGVIGTAVWSAGRAEQILGQTDPGAIVIDEIAGMGVVFAGLPFTGPLAVAGFLLFRGFDIIKPPPVGWLETRFSGGLGVVIDDVAAGLISRIILGIAFAVLAAEPGV